MGRGSRRGAALLAVVVTGLLLALGGTASAAPQAPGGCGIGSANAKGSATLDGRPVTFDLSVCEQGPKATDTGGRFTAGPDGGAVQCTDMNEHTMAFLYAVDTPVADKGKQVLVVISDGGPKPGDDRIGLTEPRSAQDFKNGCGLGDKAAQAVTQKWQPLTSGNVTVRLRLM